MSDSLPTCARLLPPPVAAANSSGSTTRELRAVLTLLAGPGVVWELAFGTCMLLQPERITSYAQAVIRTLLTDEHQRGCLMEERVLEDDLTLLKAKAEG